MLSERIGHRITELRHQKGLTQLALSQKSKLDRSYLSNIENGKYDLHISDSTYIQKTIDIIISI